MSNITIYRTPKSIRGNIGISYVSIDIAFKQREAMDSNFCNDCINCNGCIQCLKCIACNDCDMCTSCVHCNNVHNSSNQYYMTVKHFD